MTLKSISAVTAAGVTFIAAPLCAQDNAADVSVLHLWRTDAEQHALAVFRDALKAQGADWSDAAVYGGLEGVQTELSQMIAAGTVPSVVQWIPDSDARQLFESGVFATIDTVYPDLERSLIPEVNELVSDGTSTFLVPVGIHTYNFMVYNKEIIDAVGVSQPETWKDFLALGPELRERGIALVASSDEPWQVFALFRTILVSQFSREEYLQLATEGTNISDRMAPVIASVKILAELSKYRNDDYVGMNWEDVSRKVERGEALAQFLGDYIVPNFKDRDAIVCATSLESKYITWGVDTFAFTPATNAAQTAGQIMFAKAATDPVHLKEYVKRKGGLPVIKGIDPEDLDNCNSGTLANWNSSEKLWSGLVQIRKRHAVMTEIAHRWWIDGIEDPEKAAVELIEALSEI